MNIFDINFIFLNIGGYSLSYIEFVGTVLYFISVYLISRKNIITWPIGMVSVVLYFLLFYQIGLYSDMLEQVYYFIISIVGWITWRKRKMEHINEEIRTSWSSKKSILITAFVSCVTTAILSFCTMNFHEWLPNIFKKEASFPIVDALTTIMSFTAMYLTTTRKNEGWLYWIVVDIIAIWLYWIKDVRFISIQYIILLVIAVYGFINWIRKSDSGEEV